MPFIVILTGWMPAPIEISSIGSIWLKNQIKQTNINAKNALLDFNVGFIVTAILALFFLALGALVLQANAIKAIRSLDQSPITVEYIVTS